MCTPSCPSPSPQSSSAEATEATEAAFSSAEASEPASLSTEATEAASLSAGRCTLPRSARRSFVFVILVLEASSTQLSYASSFLTLPLPREFLVYVLE